MNFPEVQITLVPPYPWFYVLWFQSPVLFCDPEADDPPLTCGQKVSNSLERCPSACIHRTLS